MGDLGIFGADLENKVITSRIRDAYKKLWEVFAEKASKTVMKTMDTRFKEYCSALENKDSSKSFAETIGRQFAKCCCAEGIDVFLLASGICNIKMKALVDFIRKMDEEYEIE